jgi:hypothetical protein
LITKAAARAHKPATRHPDARPHEGSPAARTHRQQLKTVGFSDAEIDAYLARTPKALAAAR